MRNEEWGIPLAIESIPPGWGILYPQLRPKLLSSKLSPLLPVPAAHSLVSLLDPPLPVRIGGRSILLASLFCTTTTPLQNQVAGLTQKLYAAKFVSLYGEMWRCCRLQNLSYPMTFLCLISIRWVLVLYCWKECVYSSYYQQLWMSLTILCHLVSAMLPLFIDTWALCESPL